MCIRGGVLEAAAAAGWGDRGGKGREGGVMVRDEAI